MRALRWGRVAFGAGGWCAACLLLFGVAATGAHATPIVDGDVVFCTNGDCIVASDFTYEGLNVVVAQGVVHIDGAHSFASLTVRDIATLTHYALGGQTPGPEPGAGHLSLTLAGNLTIESNRVIHAAGRIDVTGKGYSEGQTHPSAASGPSTGHTGGSYGGLGHIGSSYYGVPNDTYGDYRDPACSGSGGAATGSGAGGGIVRIAVGGVVTNDGEIIANGAEGYWNGSENNSGGSGGSIRLDASVLTGGGRIRADGGAGYHGSAGGGGRVAIYYGETNGFDVLRQVTAHGGANTARPGAPGTVYLKQAGQPSVLLISSHGVAHTGAWTPLGLSGDEMFTAEHVVVTGANVVVKSERGIPLALSSLELRSGAVLTHPPTTTADVFRVDVTVSNDVVIDALSRIDVTGYGYPIGCTYGPSTNGAATERAGGSYGGLGYIGDAFYGEPNAVYGDPRDPASPGSGGAKYTAALNGSGTAGGGLVRLRAGRVRLDGRIAANGGSGYYGAYLYGGGSGGGVRIDVGELSGTGVVSAAGANGYHGGAGGGGRIAIYYDTLDGFDPERQVRAYGGVNSPRSGAPGTIYLKESGMPGCLRIAQEGLTATTAWTPFGEPSDLEFSAEHVDVRGANVVAKPEHELPLHFQRLDLRDGALLTHRPTTTEQVFRLDLTVAGTVTVDTVSQVDVSGLGYPIGYTYPLTTNGAATLRAGGSYGGLGYIDGGTYYGSPNGVYGDPRDPRLPGSGGAPYSPSINGSGSAGGGAVHLTAAELVLDGKLRADGGSAYYGIYYEGGGSGGGIRLDVGTLSGTGTVSAAGAPGYHGGAGGGGRIAIYYETTNAFSFAEQVTAAGGLNGARSGAPGTVYVEQSGGVGTLFITLPPGWPASSAWTPLGSGGQNRFDAGAVVVSGTNLVVKPWQDLPLRLDALELRNGARLVHRPSTATDDYSLTAYIDSHLLIDANSAIDVTGLGYVQGRTEGNTSDGAATGDYYGGSGGSYGGRGVDRNGQANAVYGDYRNPTLPGSGGAATGSGSGGGLVRITAGTARIDGGIVANGGASYWDGYKSNSGGSGGGILLNVGTLSGTGRVQADGGHGYHGVNAGGGRVAVYAWATNTVAATNFTASGSKGWPGSGDGEDGSVYLTGSQFVTWDHPGDTVAHDEERIGWSALGIDPATMTVNVTACLDGTPAALGVGEDLWGSVVWDTTSAPDGIYEVRADFLSGSGTVLHTLSRRYVVNNAVTWHAGPVTTSVTWSNDTVHVVDRSVVVESGVVLTLAPGVVVKFADDSRMILRDGARLQAGGTNELAVVLTALEDDTVGGDTNLDGGHSRPQPGAWGGVRTEGAAVFDRNALTHLRYVRIEHGGTLVGSETWDGSGLHMIVSDIELTNNVTLTLEAGAVVKVGLGRRLAVHAGGRLETAGTVAQPVIVTSVRDDSVAGDTNGDGDATRPQPGDWWQVHADGGVIDLDHAVVRYGGAGSGTGGTWAGGDGLIHVSPGAEVVLSGCTLRDSFFEGVACWGGGSVAMTNTVITGTDRAVNADGATVRMDHCTLYANNVGLWPHGGAIDIYNSIVSHSGSESVGAGTPRTIRYCNVWSPAEAPYAGAGANGNISTDPMYKSAVTGNLRLGYRSPCIDAADGGRPTLVDAMGGPHYDDPRTANTGIAHADGSYPDMGAFEFVETAQSDLDLIAVDIAGPASVTAGSDVTVQWRIRNIGTATVSNQWHDAVVLVPKSMNWNDAVPCGTVVSSALLGPGQEAAFSATVRVGGGAEGEWRWGVKANINGEVFEGVNWSNNLGASATALRLNVPELVVDEPAQLRRFDGGGQSHWFKVTASQGQDVLVDMDTLGAGACELYAARGAMPTRMVYDVGRAPANTPDVRVLIADAQPATYYILAYARSLSGPTDFQIGARTLDFSIDSVQPTRLGNAGRVTLRVTGGQLEEDMNWWLKGPGESRLDAESVHPVSSSEAWVTFNLTGIDPDVFQLHVDGHGQTIAAPGSCEVVDADPAEVWMDIEFPAAIRAGAVMLEPGHRLWLHYRNDSLNDMVAPLFAIRMRGARLWHAEANYAAHASDILLLGIGREGPAGVLSPGEAGSIKMYFVEDRTTNMISLSAGILRGDTPVDYDALVAGGPPESVSPYGWDVTVSNLAQTCGATLDDLNFRLADRATALSRLGRYVTDANQLMSLEIRDASVFGAIARRRAVGPFGRGMDSPAIRIENVGLDAVVHYPGGGVRIFRGAIVQLAGSQRRDEPARALEDDAGTPLAGIYHPRAYDYGILLNITNHHYELHETDGSVFTFRPDGKLDRIRDTRRHETVYGYDGELVTGWSNTLGDSVSFTYNATGRVVEARDADGHATTYDYGADGETLLAIHYADGTSNAFTYVTGEGDGREYAFQSIRGVDGQTRTFSYDAFGRLVLVQSDDGADRVEIEYLPGGVIRARDAIGATTTFYHDEEGRVARIRDADGNAVDMDYSVYDEVTRITLPNGTQARFDYDARGRLARHRSENGDAMAYSYNDDVQGRDGARLFAGYGTDMGRSFKYLHLHPHWSETGSYTWSHSPYLHVDYDDRGYLAGIVYADVTRETFACDAYGFVTNAVNGRGMVQRYGYDERRRVVGKVSSSGVVESYAYDGFGNLTNVARSVSGGGQVTTRFTYDSRERLTRVDDPRGRYLAYSYDDLNRLVRVEGSDSYRVGYVYDGGGRLSALTDAAGNTNVVYRYDGAGRLTERVAGSVSTRCTYDDLGRVLHMENRNASETLISSFAYTYDTMGRRRTMTTGEGVYTYGYDAAGQLTSVTDPVGRETTYEYDGMGNRIRSTTDGQARDFIYNQLGQCVQDGTSTFTYDADGNLQTARRGGVLSTYTYDENNRLVKAETPEGITTYEYNPAGHLTARTANGVRNEFLIDPLNPAGAVAEYDSRGRLKHQFVYGLLLEGRLSGGYGQWYAFDDRGHTSELLDGGGTVLNRYRYDVHGKAVTVSETTPNAYRYAGGWGVQQDVHGWLHMGLRHYSPALGRFVSRDPIGAAGGLNLYAYALNDPVSHGDPYGTASETWTKTRERWANRLGYAGIPHLIMSGRADKAVDAAKQSVDFYRRTRLLSTGAEHTRLAVLQGKAQVALAKNAKYASRLTNLGHGMNALGVINNAYNIKQAYDKGDWDSGFKNGAGIVATGIGYVPGFQWVPAAATATDVVTESLFGWYWYRWADNLTAENENWLKQRKGMIRVIGSLDPNDITGPAGYGDQAFIVLDTTMNYLIRFENRTNATAAALFVTITNDLSPTLDYSTFELGDMGFGDYMVEVPAGRTFYSARVDARETVGLYVDIDAEFNPDTGSVLWRFSSVDPVTDGFPEDPFAGFLPPNTNAPAGEGWVRYSVRPRTNLTNSARIPAEASIVFDWNDPIWTAPITNTIDDFYPRSMLDALPGLSPRDIALSWSGTDPDGSGIEGYDLFVSREGAPYVTWLDGTTNTTALYRGEPGVRYRFYTLATDNVGLRESLTSNLVETTTELRILGIKRRGADGDELTWESATGMIYRITAGTNLLDGLGTQSEDMPATPPENMYTNAIPDGKGPRYYRILRATP